MDTRFNALLNWESGGSFDERLSLEEITHSATLFTDDEIHEDVAITKERSWNEQPELM